MSKKSDLKKPDVVTAKLQGGFTWTTKHMKLLTVLIVVLITVGGGLSVYGYVNRQKEAELQAQFAKIEKKYLTKKEGFEKAKAAAEAKAKTAKAKPGEKTPEVPEVKETPATGDLDQDYGDVVTELEALVAKAPSSKAAKLAALNLTEIYVDYKKTDKVAEVLGKVKKDENDLLSGLAKHRYAVSLADVNQCDQAIKAWDEIISNKKFSFMHAQAKLKQGLCFEALGDMTKAQSRYEEVRNDKESGQLSASAEKYLRLLKSKAN